MTERAFVIQQIGVKDSPDRKRADEIYRYIIVPAVKAVGLEPYRADLDLSPGAITPKMLGELLSARVVIADLTGRNPNVFYELGVTHSFVRPLISIADSARSLPFDAKDERVIELGEYPASGLAYAQGEQAKTSLQESLEMVLADGYKAPSPLGEAAANRSVDQLAPENPLAAEMAQIRETLEDIRRRAMPPAEFYEIREYLDDIRRIVESSDKITSRPEFYDQLRATIERRLEHLTNADLSLLRSEARSSEEMRWTDYLMGKWTSMQKDKSES